MFVISLTFEELLEGEQEGRVRVGLARQSDLRGLQHDVARRRQVQQEAQLVVGRHAQHADPALTLLLALLSGRLQRKKNNFTFSHMDTDTEDFG